MRNGGGIMVIVKKHLTISNCHISDDFEMISFKINSKSSCLNVVSCYKPPRTPKNEFLDYLEKVRLNLDTNEPIVIVADFNINQGRINGQCLKEFLENNGLKTVVSSPTRLCVSKFKSNGSELDSSTIIDHLIVGDDQSIACEVIGCPFSDHKFVVGAIEFEVGKPIDPLTFYRNLSTANLNQLKNELLKADFSLMDKLCTIEDKWDYLKSVIFEKMDLFCLLKQAKKKDNTNHNPWFDSDLQSLKNKRD
ncbi:RNA-directed DNA polymerase from mobile element jockey-like [Brachionus plicatilis]|uniref:RNA-directed DNA polymerase from mobile element jockey-like n=1 Tax=Brachionus plicatilis TaxID=10195 RepID=A0A3M7T0M5_BRAPC|nr:RNA-directed DNA polymerase from mobile element jockey-like [Brachionus plicatilis]